MNNFLFSFAVFTANVFGVIAIVCKIFEYQVKKRGTTFALATIASLCWVLYFIFLGNVASGLTCLIGTLKLPIFMHRGKRKWADSVWWLVLFLVLQAFITIFTISSWVDVFCVSAGFLGVLAYFFKDAKKYRFFSFLTMSLWVANSIANFYLIALLSDSFSTVSCGVAIVRYDIMKDNKKQICEQSNDCESLSKDCQNEQ